MSNLSNKKASSCAKKDQQKALQEDGQLSFQQIQSISLCNQDQHITVVVIPCGKEDGKNSADETPYEIKLKKKANENSLKEIFLRKESLWSKIFKQHLSPSDLPSFSIYRKPFEADQDPTKADLFLHILYMKSSEKALSRNYNAQELELFCHNRFYGPLVVAYNLNKHPYYLMSFLLGDLKNIEQINRNFQNKSIKDDYVPDCLLNFMPLNLDLEKEYKLIEAYTFYMFKYKSSWCPNKKDSHDSKSCIYAHHTRDFRRPPDVFKYLPEDCDTLVQGIGWDKCEKGLKCNKCHTTVERLYHPEKYKRIFCDRSRCNQSEICAFYHSIKERSQAGKECKAYKKLCSKKQAIDINHLHHQLLQFYKNQSIQLALLEEAKKKEEQQNQKLQQEEAKQIILKDQNFLNQNENFKNQISKIPKINDKLVPEIIFPKTTNLNSNQQQYGNNKQQFILNQQQNSNLDSNSPQFQPSFRQPKINNIVQIPCQLQQLQQHMQISPSTQQQQQQQIQQAQQQQQQQIYLNTPERDQFFKTPPHIQNSTQHQIQSMHLLSPPTYVQTQNFIEDQNAEIAKQIFNLFDPLEIEDRQTRTSTFSHQSINAREDIKRSNNIWTDHIMQMNKQQNEAFYGAFQGSFNGLLLRPIDNEEQQLQQQQHQQQQQQQLQQQYQQQVLLSQNTPVQLARQQSSKSPSNLLHSPIILDFLDDETYFNQINEKVKSKTEFVVRARQESEDSGGAQDEIQIPGVSSDYLNSILPNNSIKFSKPSQSRFSFSQGSKRE